MRVALSPQETQRLTDLSTAVTSSGRYRGGMSCVFCDIVAGDAPAVRVYEDADYLGILDIRPFTRGHTLVLPKRHTVDLTDTPPETCAGMVGIGQRIAMAARASELKADGNNIVINDGRAAFQSVFHIHLHVVPRQNGDKLSFAKGMLLRRDPDREATGQILRDALAQLDATG
jgi:histidine triad (HIT) family protein